MTAKRYPVRRPALEPLELPAIARTIYPPPYDKIVAGRTKRKLAKALGLSDFGVNLSTLQPGAASSMRHYHSANDEFVYIVDGEATLVTDAGKQLLTTGMCAGFPKGTTDAHHLVNEGTRPVTYLEVGTNFEPDLIGYPDQKLFLYDTSAAEPRFTRTPSDKPPNSAAKARAKRKR